MNLLDGDRKYGYHVNLTSTCKRKYPIYPKLNLNNIKRHKKYIIVIIYQNIKVSGLKFKYVPGYPVTDSRLKYPKITKKKKKSSRNRWKKK